jgi:hypothetical protein
MASKITDRIAVQAGLPELVSALAGRIPSSDLQSLMLEVYQSRTRDTHPSKLLARHSGNALCRPSAVDARRLAAFDRVAFETAGDFEAIELSPVCVLGAHHSLGLTSQNNILTTIRNAEVLGDPTIALALECALRRNTRAGEVRLCASHRVARMQPFAVAGFTPHFRLFALVTAGRDSGSSRFELQHLREHLEFYLSLLRALSPEALLSPLRWWKSRT